MVSRRYKECNVMDVEKRCTVISPDNFNHGFRNIFSKKNSSKAMIEIIKSTKNNNLIAYNGYIFEVKRRNNSIIKWNCDERGIC